MTQTPLARLETKAKPKPLRGKTPPTLRIIPLGGVGEFGMNMMCYEAGGERLVIDCGSMFPGPDMPGVDLVIPDIAYLEEEPERLKAVVLTHGHEDHIGALPFFLSKINVPVYATRLTLALAEHKLREHRLLGQVKLHELKCRETVAIGSNFEVTPIHVTHSIPDAVSIAVRTRAGTVVHTGDYKIDLAPIDGEAFDFYSFSRLGEEGVLALVGDSTNSDVRGSTHSERWVSQHLEPIFAASSQAIVCATFSTSVHRLQIIMDLAVRHNRKIFVAGRSLENIFAICSDLGYLSIPMENFCALRDLRNVPRSQRLILATGSQGEPMSVMARVALGEHKQIKVEEGDSVILSSRMIPGNFRAVYRMINHLYRRGARVYDQSTPGIHSSGHAYSEEMKAMIGMVRPRFLIPVHGELRQQKEHERVGLETGFDPEAILIVKDGDVIELHPENALLVDTVSTGHVFVDGKTVGETGEVVLRDRQHLSEDGMLIAILNVDQKTGELITPPEIVTRGFVYVERSEDLINDLRDIVREAFEACSRESREESGTINAAVRRALRKYIRKNYDRYPLILPVVQEI